MPKNKTHKGISKRVRITKSGKVRHARPYRSHKRSNKTAKRRRNLRGGMYASGPEAKRMRRGLFRRLRGRNTPAQKPATAPAEE
ncbi:MAG: 50S ribosomal protein L35 [Phycisphaerales bacterium]|nr:50S ribosomal protein L35 [Phycisphaerales bacterium]